MKEQPSTIGNRLIRSRLALAAIAVLLLATGYVWRELFPELPAKLTGDPAVAEEQIAQADSGKTRDSRASKSQEKVASVGSEAARVTAAGVVSSTTGGTFEFPKDLGGELLKDRLPPPRRVNVPDVKFVDQPQAWRGMRMDRLPRDLEALPRAATRKDPQLLARTETKGLAFSATDVPQLAAELDPRLPEAVRLIPAAKSYVPSKDAARVPELAGQDAPPKERIEAAHDPARTYSETSLFRLRAAIVGVAAPFLKVGIPDPQENARGVGPPAATAEADPPAYATGKPGTAPMTTPADPPK